MTYVSNTSRYLNPDMRNLYLLSASVLASAGLLSAQTNLIINPSFEDGPTSATPAGWDAVTSASFHASTQPGGYDPPNFGSLLFGAIPAVTTPAMPNPTDGANFGAVYRNSSGLVSIGFGVLAQTFTLPDEIKNAKIQFDYAYSANVLDFNVGNYIQVGIFEGDLTASGTLATVIGSLNPLAIIFETNPGDPLNTSGFATLPSYDLAALFSGYEGQDLTLAFIVANLTPLNRYINFAVDNILLLVNEPSGGGTGTSSASKNAVRDQQNRQQQLIRQRQQQTFRAHQARVARDQRLAAARRAASR